jgi:hypothetical protein
MQLQAGAVYLIELCSGEQCRWRLPGSVDVCFAAALASQKASHKDATLIIMDYFRGA